MPDNALTAQAATFGLGAFISVVLLGALIIIVRAFIDYARETNATIIKLVSENTAANVGLTTAIQNTAAATQKTIEVLSQNLRLDEQLRALSSGKGRRADD